MSPKDLQSDPAPLLAEIQAISPAGPAPWEGFPVEAPQGNEAARPVVGRRAIAGLGLAATDAVALVLPILLATLALGAEGSAGGLLRSATLAAVAFLAFKAIAGLYPGFGLHPEARLRKGLKAWVLACGLGVLAHWLIAEAGAASVALLAAALVAGGMLRVAAAAALRQGLDALGLWGVPVALRGDPEKVAALGRFLREERGYGYTPTQGEAGVVLWAGTGMPAPDRLEELRHGYGEILLVSDLPKLALSGLHPADHGGALGLRIVPRREGPRQAGLKRAFDLTLAVPATVLALPVLALAALAIRRADPGPVFFVQPREGRGGRPIGVLKLRTMYLEADAMLAELLDRDPAARAEWEMHFKLRRDPRVLPVIGPLLRATSLDELPQLLNVLRGEMSLVGPRPFPDYHLAALPESFRRRRASVVPGLTGLWQISDRSAADLAEQVQLDGHYLDGRSFWLDLSIFLRTFAAVLGGRGAY